MLICCPGWEQKWQKPLPSLGPDRKRARHKWKPGSGAGRSPGCSVCLSDSSAGALQGFKGMCKDFLLNIWLPAILAACLESTVFAQGGEVTAALPSLCCRDGVLTPPPLPARMGGCSCGGCCPLSVPVSWWCSSCAAVGDRTCRE